MDDANPFQNGPFTIRPALVHDYSFDPTHGYRLPELLTVTAPPEPDGFVAFWKDRYSRACAVDPDSEVRRTGRIERGWREFDWAYRSTGGTLIRGWMLIPEHGEVKRALLIGHGYGGRTAPDFDCPVENTALFFYCARGLGRSRHTKISSNPMWHVLHDIGSPDHYVIGGCVEDIWTGVSALLTHYPEIAGRVGYAGTSFGGGIGALALAWDARIRRAHFKVPTFGNQPLRMQLPSTGSARSVQQFLSKHSGNVDCVLALHDASLAARHIRQPVHSACALFDPSVAPAGQFAIHNALAGPKRLMVLTAGHHQYPGMAVENRRLRQELHNFFRDI